MCLFPNTIKFVFFTFKDILLIENHSFSLVNSLFTFVHKVSWFSCSYYKFVSSANRTHFNSVETLQISSIYKIYNFGLKIEP